MELVPPNSEKITKFTKASNIPTKKVKVEVKTCQTSIFSAKLQQKVKVWQTLTWTFTFLVGIFAIFGELSYFFSLLDETSSILRTFLCGTSQKRHPVVLNETLQQRFIVYIVLGFQQIALKCKLLKTQDNI